MLLPVGTTVFCIMYNIGFDLWIEPEFYCRLGPLGTDQNLLSDLGGLFYALFCLLKIQGEKYLPILPGWATASSVMPREGQKAQDSCPIPLERHATRDSAVPRCLATGIVLFYLKEFNERRERG
jgi:hypothetical protein